MTDAEREDIDANAKRLLRDLNASIRGLAEAEALHQETQQVLIRKQYAGPSFRFVGLGTTPKSPEQTAAEEAQTQAAAHHESILWYLRQRLQACGRAQQTMMEARLARMVVETTAASQQHALVVGATNPAPRGSGGGFGGASASAAALEEEQNRGQPSYAPQQGHGGGDGGNDGAAADLTAEQIQMFEKGNQDMLKHYETTLDKVRYVFFSPIPIQYPIKYVH